MGTPSDLFARALFVAIKAQWKVTASAYPLQALPVLGQPLLGGVEDLPGGGVAAFHHDFLKLAKQGILRQRGYVLQHKATRALAQNGLQAMQ